MKNYYKILNINKNATLKEIKKAYKHLALIYHHDRNKINDSGKRFKLISEALIVGDNISCITEPKLIKIDHPLAKVSGVLNAICIQTDQLETLFMEGEGAGGIATASSVISDLYQISLNSNLLSLGYKTSNLKVYDKLNYSEKISSFYIRIMTKDITGVLSKITSYFDESGISIEKILQLPETKNKNLPTI